MEGLEIACVWKLSHRAVLAVWVSVWHVKRLDRIANGSWLPLSDIDLVIESKTLSSQHPRRQIEQLAHVIRNSGIAKSVQAIAHAKVPIVKFKTIQGKSLCLRWYRPWH